MYRVLRAFVEVSRRCDPVRWLTEVGQTHTGAVTRYRLTVTESGLAVVSTVMLTDNCEIFDFMTVRNINNAALGYRPLL